MLSQSVEPGAASKAPSASLFLFQLSHAMEADRTDFASEHIGGRVASSHCVMAKFTTYNFGMDQNMLEKGPWARTHRFKFGRLMDMFREDYSADMVFGCEVGGHMRGFCGASTLEQLLQDHNVMSEQNYIVALNDTQVSMKLTHDPFALQLTSVNVYESQLVLTAVQGMQAPMKVPVILVGNLHIRTPNGVKALTPNQRQLLVKEALDKMHAFAEQLKTEMPASERHEPLQVLLGDCNLNKHFAEVGLTRHVPAMVPTTSDVWQVKTTPCGKSGGVCFVKGCTADVFEVEVGASYMERGMRNDQHDALGVVLRVPLLHVTQSAHVPEPPEEVNPTSAPDDDEVTNDELSAAVVASRQLSWWLLETKLRHEAQTLTHEVLDKLEPILASIDAASDFEEYATQLSTTRDEIVANARRIAKLYSEKLMDKPDSLSADWGNADTEQEEAALHGYEQTSCSAPGKDMAAEVATDGEMTAKRDSLASEQTSECEKVGSANDVVTDVGVTLKPGEQGSASEEAGVAREERSETPAASGQAPRNALSHGLYEFILQYFNKRLDTPGIEQTDVQLRRLGHLLFSKRQVPFRSDPVGDTKLAGKIIAARRACANY